MPIPGLNASGLLPEGVHACTRGEVQAVFGGGNPSIRRQALWRSFGEFLAWIEPMRFFTEIYIDGSFVTDEPAPKDVDVILTLPQPSLEVFRRMREEDIVRVFNRPYVKATYQVDVWPNADRPFSAGSTVSSSVVEAFQILRPAEAARRGLPPGSRRGILRIRL
jgi:hypothetical protein